MKQAELWRRPKVLEATGLSKTSLYRRINENTFPAPISLGSGIKTRTKVWISTEVNQWISEVIAAARTGSLNESR